jgi:hypothetical protein
MTFYVSNFFKRTELNINTLTALKSLKRHWSIFDPWIYATLQTYYEQRQELCLWTPPESEPKLLCKKLAGVKYSRETRLPCNEYKVES